jgi:putative hydrolase of the HAD superfamily
MPVDLRNIKAVIFDLDDTLYDCSGTLVLRGRKKVAKTLAKLVNCSEDTAYLLQLKTDEELGAKANIYEKIVSLYNLPPHCAEELLEEFIHVDISNINLFPDVIDTLVKLKKKGYTLILITSGENHTQRKKIEVLGLNGNYFDEILIAERNNGKTKKNCFQDVIQKYNLKPGEIVCIGDKIEDELTAANSLGITTVMFEHGRHYNAYLTGKDKHIKPDYSIKQIKEIITDFPPIRFAFI